MVVFVVIYADITKNADSIVVKHYFITLKRI